MSSSVGKIVASVVARQSERNGHLRHQPSVRPMHWNLHPPRPVTKQSYLSWTIESIQHRTRTKGSQSKLGWARGSGTRTGSRAGAVQCGAAKSACGACQGRKTQRSRSLRVGGWVCRCSPRSLAPRAAKARKPPRHKQTAATTVDVFEPSAQIPRMDAKDDKAHDGARIRALWQKERHDANCHVVFCWFLDQSSLSGGVPKPSRLVLFWGLAGAKSSPCLGFLGPST